MSEQAQYTAGIKFRDGNMPDAKQDAETEAGARAALSGLLQQYAAVKSGYILDREEGSKAVFLPDGTYMFTVPVL